MPLWNACIPIATTYPPSGAATFKSRLRDSAAIPKPMPVIAVNVQCVSPFSDRPDEPDAEEAAEAVADERPARRTRRPRSA